MKTDVVTNPNALIDEHPIIATVENRLTPTCYSCIRSIELNNDELLSL